MGKSENNQTDAIGIFGGTFDPIHYGHLRTGLDVAEQLCLSSVRFVPCARPPHRAPPLASPQQRLRLIECAVLKSKQFVTDDREINRQGASYTIDTLIDMRAEFSQSPLYLLIGSDVFLQIHTWDNWQQLLDLTHIVVVTRPGKQWVMQQGLSSWYHHHLAVKTDNRLLAGRIWPVTVTQLELSATAIRNKIAQGSSVQYLLPDAVIELIDEFGLYQSNITA